MSIFPPSLLPSSGKRIRREVLGLPSVGHPSKEGGPDSKHPTTDNDGRLPPADATSLSNNNKNNTKDHSDGSAADSDIAATSSSGIAGGGRGNDGGSAKTDRAVDGADDDGPVPGENAKLTHEKVDVRPTKNIKMKQHLCVKHALPKTRLTNAILYENVSQGRHLEMKLAGLQHNKHRSQFTMDLNKRAFVAQQDRKRTKWKKDDEVRISGMNLPSFSPVGDKPGSNPTTAGASRCGIDRRASSVKTIYHMSGADARSESADAGGRKPLLPMMKIRRERTEIVSHHDKVFVTKLPSVVEVDHNKLNVHNAYCGKSLLDRGVPSRDDRFRRLHTTLSPAILKEEDEYHSENLTSKSRMCKYAHLTTNSDHLSTSQRPPEARVMVASRGNPVAAGLDLPSLASAAGGGGGRQRTHGIDFITEHKTGGKEIIELFKSKDIKSLARSLTTDAAGMGMGMTVTTGAETQRSMTSNNAITRSRHHRQQPKVFVPVVDIFYKVKTGS